jgi:catechol 2,3-dioxygenase-like lactoylglutathione lyase family enzyme
MQPLALDHVALFVADVPRSVHFYQNVLGWEPLPRPAFDFPGAWFHLGGGHQLHLLCDEYAAVALDPSVFGSRRNHFAVRVANVAEAAAYFAEQGLTFTGPKPRPDGVPQLFLQDPDGYWIEFNE